MSPRTPQPSTPKRPGELDRAALTGDAARIARVVGAELLAQVKKKSEDLQADDEPEALHDFRVAVRRLRSWLRAFDESVSDTVRGKHRRRLQEIADATRASRDLEVHIEWVKEFARKRRRKNRQGTEWLVTRLESKKARADLALRRVLDADLQRAIVAVDKALGRYTVRVHEPNNPFASVTAALVRSHAVAARTALSRVTSVGDRLESHEARIAAKRLRYLLEPLRPTIDRTQELVEELSKLQDDFGALHDAQLFGSEIARLLAKVLSSNAKLAADQTDDSPEKDRAEVLLAISRRLHRDEEDAFARIEKSWLGDRMDALWPQIESVAATLDDIAAEVRRAERRYLLRGMVTDTPPASIVELDYGVVPGERVAESVTRLSNSDGAHYRRAIEAPDASDHAAMDYETTERVYTAMWPLTKGHRLRVRRHVIETDGRRWTIDELLDRELVLARVTLADPREVAAIPEWLEPMIERDVTDESEYDLRALTGK